MSKSPIKTIVRGGKLVVKGGTAGERAEARDAWDDAIGDYKGEPNSTAQARDQQRNKKNLANARTVTNIMMRQSPNANDMAQVAAALRTRFSKQRIAELCRELRER